MDWEGLRERTLGEVGTHLVTEGAGTAGGLIGAAFIGRQVQNLSGQTDVAGGFTDISKAAMAWGANNLPKALIWWFTRKYAIGPGETVTPGREMISDARKAFAGSIVFDTLMRLSNKGINPASATLFGQQVLGSGVASESTTTSASIQADVQRLIQENSALRAELNKALQKLGMPVDVAQTPEVQRRQKRFAFAESEAVQPKPRPVRYGFMEGSDVKAESAATLHNML